jgi:hypothetical protein
MSARETHEWTFGDGCSAIVSTLTGTDEHPDFNVSDADGRRFQGDIPAVFAAEILRLASFHHQLANMETLVEAAKRAEREKIAKAVEEQGCSCEKSFAYPTQESHECLCPQWLAFATREGRIG